MADAKWRNKSIGYFQSYYENAKKYEMHLPVAEEVDRVYRFMNKGPVSGLKALDFGCGEGRNTRYLCDLGYKVKALDVAPSAVDLTMKRLGGRDADVELHTHGQSVGGSGEYHLILAYEVLQWLGSRDNLLLYLNMFRGSLHPRGVFILSMPAENHYHTLSGIDLGESRYEVTTEQRKGCVQYAPDLPAIKALLAGAGFAVEVLGVHAYGYDGKEHSSSRLHSMYMFGCLPR